MRAPTTVFLASVGFVLASCAKDASQIPPMYVPPYQYERLKCTQLAEEAQRVSASAAQAAGIQNENASRDAFATGVAIVIFWPAAFFIGGYDQNTAELARLRGEMEAIEEVAARKHCNIQFRRY